MENKLTDEKITGEVGTIIDELAKAGKKAVGGFFKLMVERTADTASDLTDKGVEKLKKKIDETVSKDDSKTND